MGYYINQNSKGDTLPARGKALELLKEGKLVIPQPLHSTEWQENLVCVVENAMFDAAAYVYSVREMDRILDAKRNGDARKYTWIIHEDAKKLSNFKDFPLV